MSVSELQVDRRRRCCCRGSAQRTSAAAPASRQGVKRAWCCRRLATRKARRHMPSSPWYIDSTLLHSTRRGNGCCEMVAAKWLLHEPQALQQCPALQPVLRRTGLLGRQVGKWASAHPSFGSTRRRPVENAGTPTPTAIGGVGEHPSGKKHGSMGACAGPPETNGGRAPRQLGDAGRHTSSKRQKARSMGACAVQTHLNRMVVERPDEFDMRANTRPSRLPCIIRLTSTCRWAGGAIGGAHGMGHSYPKVGT